MLMTSKGRATYDTPVGLWHVIIDGVAYRHADLNVLAEQTGLTEEDKSELFAYKNEVDNDSTS